MHFSEMAIRLPMESTVIWKPEIGMSSIFVTLLEFWRISDPSRKMWRRTSWTHDRKNWNVIFEKCCYVFMPCPSMGPKWFWTVLIVLDGYKLFWLGRNCSGQVQITNSWIFFFHMIQNCWVGLDTNCFGQVQITILWNIVFWFDPKWFGPNQNKLDQSKTIGT